jgi:hypothetical protein
MAKLIRNVGKYPGLNGAAVIYLCEDDAGRKFLSNRSANSSDPAVLGTFKFMPRSTMESAIVSGNGAFIAKAIAYADLQETAPTGLLDANGDVTISNTRLGGGTFPRIHADQALFSIKGEGYESAPSDTTLVSTATDITAWKTPSNAKTGDTGGTGTTTGALSSAKNAWEQAQDWVNANPILGTAVILILLYVLLKEVFGIDLLEELGFKKKGKGKGKGKK